MKTLSTLTSVRLVVGLIPAVFLLAGIIILSPVRIIKTSSRCWHHAAWQWIWTDK